MAIHGIKIAHVPAFTTSPKSLSSELVILVRSNGIVLKYPKACLEDKFQLLWLFMDESEDIPSKFHGRHTTQ